jgi:hypothetical protein
MTNSNCHCLAPAVIEFTKAIIKLRPEETMKNRMCSPSGDQAAVFAGASHCAMVVHYVYSKSCRLLTFGTGCPLILYPNLLLIWYTESKSDVIEIMDYFSCFLHNINSASRIQDAT